MSLFGHSANQQQDSIVAARRRLGLAQRWNALQQRKVPVNVEPLGLVRGEAATPRECYRSKATCAPLCEGR
jgi:hypothetical protein